MISERISAQMKQIGNASAGGTKLEILRKVCFADVCGIKLETKPLISNLMTKTDLDIGEVLKSLADEFLVNISSEGNYIEGLHPVRSQHIINSKSTTKATETTTEAKSVDLDLTKLSSTLVYSEVYNMLITPDDYKGKIIKMKGQFNQYTDEETGKIHNAVIIPDATACCQQGLEFELSDKTNPNFEQNTEITVVGTFDTYSDGKFLYCHLKNAKIIDE